MACVILMTDYGNLVINRWASGSDYKGQSISETRFGKWFIIFFLVSSVYLYSKVGAESDIEYYSNRNYETDSDLGILIILLFIGTVILIAVSSQRNYNFNFELNLVEKDTKVPDYYQWLYTKASCEEIRVFRNRLNRVEEELVSIKHYLEDEWPYINNVYLNSARSITCNCDKNSWRPGCFLKSITIWIDEEKCKPDIYSKSISLDIELVTDSRKFLHTDCWIGSYKMDLLNVKNHLSRYLEKEGANFYWLARTGHNKPGYSS